MGMWISKQEYDESGPSIVHRTPREEDGGSEPYFARLDTQNIAAFLSACHFRSGVAPACQRPILPGLFRLTQAGSFPRIPPYTWRCRNVPLTLPLTRYFFVSLAH